MKRFVLMAAGLVISGLIMVSEAAAQGNDRFRYELVSTMTYDPFLKRSVMKLVLGPPSQLQLVGTWKSITSRAGHTSIDTYTFRPDGKVIRVLYEDGVPVSSKEGRFSYLQSWTSGWDHVQGHTFYRDHLDIRWNDGSLASGSVERRNRNAFGFHSGIQADYYFR
jgi:hypothetical protein